MVKTAVIQQPPAYFNLPASLDRAVELINEAASSGANLIVFPEAWFPGYPDFAWRCEPNANDAAFTAFYKELSRNSVNLSKGDLKPVQDAARDCGVVVIAGIEEIDSEAGGSTIFNTACIIDADGKIANVHRKLMPTDAERRVWGFGDARGLGVVDTAVGRIGTLLCWENYMPLARYALYAQNMEILVSPTADVSDLWISSMKHIAFEGGCYVIACATAIQAKDIPSHLPFRDEIYGDPEEWLLDGNAIVCDPSGKAIAGPNREEKQFLWAEIDPSSVAASRRAFDATGHYARPDVFHLTVDRSPRNPVTIK